MVIGLKPVVAKIHKTGYFLGVLIKMVSLAEFSESRMEKSPKVSSQERMDWLLLDAKPRGR